MIHRHSGKFPLESVLRVGEEFSVKNVSTRRESQGLLLATAVWGKRGTAARPRVVGGRSRTAGVNKTTWYLAIQMYRTRTKKTTNKNRRLILTRK